MSECFNFNKIDITEPELVLKKSGETIKEQYEKFFHVKAFFYYLFEVGYINDDLFLEIFDLVSDRTSELEKIYNDFDAFVKKTENFDGRKFDALDPLLFIVAPNLYNYMPYVEENIIVEGNVSQSLDNLLKDLKNYKENLTTTIKKEIAPKWKDINCEILFSNIQTNLINIETEIASICKQLKSTNNAEY